MCVNAFQTAMCVQTAKVLGLIKYINNVSIRPCRVGKKTGPFLKVCNLST